MYFTEKMMTMKKKLLEDGSIMSKSKGFFSCASILTMSATCTKKVSRRASKKFEYM